MDDKNLEVTIAFRVSRKVADYLEELAQQKQDGSSRLSKHKVARSIFAEGLKNEHNIELA